MSSPAAHQPAVALARRPATYVVRDDQRGRREAQGRDHMNGQQAPSISDPKRGRVQDRGEGRLSVDDIAVQHAAARHDHAHGRDRGFVRIEQLPSEARESGDDRAEEYEPDGPARFPRGEPRQPRAPTRGVLTRRFVRRERFGESDAPFATRCHWSSSATRDEVGP